MGIKKALITGASSGIGRSLAFVLAKNGYFVLLVGRNYERLLEVHQEIGGRIIQADLATEVGVAAVCRVIEEEAPELVVNNAGIGHYGPVLDQETIHLLLQLNCEALVELSKCAAKTALLHKKKAVILNISSVLAFFEAPYAALYAASKRFVLDFSLAFNDEVREEGISVLCACPGKVATNFQLVASGGKMSVESSERFILTSREVAEALWLQIQQEKPLQIINWHYRVLVFVSHFFPKKILRLLCSAVYKKRSQV
jgi:uncharacterized protein